MARTKGKNTKESRSDKARVRIWGARRRLERSLLGPLLGNVRVIECEGKAEDPLLACVDPEQGVVWVNPHQRSELGEPEWTFVLGHQLLHLGLNHGSRRLDRDPLLWNLACEHAVDNLLHSFKLGRPLHDFPVDLTFAGLREEEIYERLSEDRGRRMGLKTYAGVGRADLVHRAKVASHGTYNRKRRDYETLLAEG